MSLLFAQRVRKMGSSWSREKLLIVQWMCPSKKRPVLPSSASRKRRASWKLGKMVIRRLAANVQRDSLALVSGTLGSGLEILCSWRCGDNAAFALHSPVHWYKIGGLNTTTKRLCIKVTRLNHSPDSECHPMHLRTNTMKSHRCD